MAVSPDQKWSWRKPTTLLPFITITLRAAFNPDGARILTASTDKTAKLWDATSGKLIASLKHQDYVKYAAFSPDGARILTACWGHSLIAWLGPRMRATANLWDAASGKLVASLAGPEIVDVVYGTFSPDGTRILTANIDNTARLWDAASGKLIASFENLDPPWSGMDYLEVDRPAVASWRRARITLLSSGVRPQAS